MRKTASFTAGLLLLAQTTIASETTSKPPTNSAEQAVACRTPRTIDCAANCEAGEEKKENKNRKGKTVCTCAPACPKESGDIKL